MVVLQLCEICLQLRDSVPNPRVGVLRGMTIIGRFDSSRFESIRGRDEQDLVGRQGRRRRKKVVEKRKKSKTGGGGGGGRGGGGGEGRAGGRPRTTAIREEPSYLSPRSDPL
mmetsp:Transcript_80198/g.166915  ORF Transcript_80198/g.166915 Transcript_80198/m.166915 type:complete len:112 (+) Transcript_80198:163-498(+)